MKWKTFDHNFVDKKFDKIIKKLSQEIRELSKG